MTLTWKRTEIEMARVQRHLEDEDVEGAESAAPTIGDEPEPGTVDA